MRFSKNPTTNKILSWAFMIVSILCILYTVMDVYGDDQKAKAMTVMENSLPKHGYDVDSELTPINVQAKISFPTYYWSTFVTKENRNKNYAAMKKAGVKISKDDADRPYYYQVYASKKGLFNWEVTVIDARTDKQKTYTTSYNGK